ncbi:MAG: hypothetical protein N2517_07200 [Ignavibacteria bacterium]|nr:hypothetical protein [Ignavibacteria bacterium]
MVSLKVCAMKYLIDENRQFQLVNSIIHKTTDIVNHLVNSKESSPHLIASITLVLFFVHQFTPFIHIYLKERKPKELDPDLIVNFEQTLTNLTLNWKNFEENPEIFMLNWYEFLENWDRLYKFLKKNLNSLDFPKIYLN